MIAVAEAWRPVDGWPYDVSDHGRVRRNPPSAQSRAVGGVLRARAGVNGYPVVQLCGEGRRQREYVHRLVATAFHGPQPTPAHVVNHRDGVKTNNQATNLEWVTEKENQRHARATGLNRNYGAGSPLSKLTEEQVLAIRRRAREGVRLRQLAAEHGLSYQGARDVVVRRCWSHLPDVRPTLPELVASLRIRINQAAASGLPLSLRVDDARDVLIALEELVRFEERRGPGAH